MQHPIDPRRTDRAMHVCFVTDDIVAFSRRLADVFGAEPPVIHTSFPPEVARVRVDGMPSDASFRQAFLSWGGTEFEMIEPGPEPSSWRTFLDERGTGIHHLGFTVTSLDDTASELAASGAPVRHEGRYPGGRYCYVDTTAGLGTMIELLEFEAGPMEQA